MLHAATDPEKDPLSPDAFDRLEEMHQRFIEKQEAWRKLLENLDELKKKNDPNTEQPNPSQ